MDLCSWLEENNPCLYQYVKTIRKAVEPILDRPVLFHFTDHSVEHSERVIEKLNGLTEVLMKNSDYCLSTTEVYILLAAAYLHDVGMQDQRMTNDEKWIRDHHHELTREMIHSYLNGSGEYIMLGLPRLSSVDDTVASVAEAHRIVNLFEAMFDEYYLTLETTVETKFIKNSNSTVDQSQSLFFKVTREERIRPRLLAALLRFADELDIDWRRVSMERLKLINAKPDTHLYWYLCDYVDKVFIQNEFITIYYRFPTSYKNEQLHIRKLVETEIELKLTNLKNIFWPYGVKPALNSSPQIEYTDVVKVLPDDVKIVADEKYLQLRYRPIEDLSRILPS